MPINDTIYRSFLSKKGRKKNYEIVFPQIDYRQKPAGFNTLVYLENVISLQRTLSWHCFFSSEGYRFVRTGQELNRKWFATTIAIGFYQCQLAFRLFRRKSIHTCVILIVHDLDNTVDIENATFDVMFNISYGGLGTNDLHLAKERTWQDRAVLRKTFRCIKSQLRVFNSTLKFYLFFYIKWLFIIS